MTGLDPEKDAIIEMATLITDNQLNVIAQGPHLILNQPASRFVQMDRWNQDHHSASGLWPLVVASEVSLAEAEQKTLDFIRCHVGPKESPLCGNSIWQDRRFLARHMPTLEAYLHYRLIDVSTLKELGLRWYGDTAKFTKEKGAHRALDDILESLEELKHYRKLLFNVGSRP